jgi:hypothetical protein
VKLLVFEHSRPQGVPSQTAVVIERVEVDHLPLSLDGPEPSIQVVLQVLTESPSRGHPKRPLRIESDDSTVDVTPAQMRILDGRAMKDDDALADQRKDLRGELMTSRQMLGGVFRTWLRHASDHSDLVDQSDPTANCHPPGNVV